MKKQATRKKSLKKYWFVPILLIFLVLFFYPKGCGNWGTSIEATYKECNCIGIKTTEHTLGGAPYYCLGICFNCKCMHYDQTGPTKGLIPCKTGIECSSSIWIKPSVPLETVRKYTPSDLSEIVNNGAATPCVNYDLITEMPRNVCMACGWICSLESPYFWRFTYNDEQLNVYVWDVQCMGTGLEYRLKGQEVKKGYKVIIER